MRHSDIRTTMNVYGDIVTDAYGKKPTPKSFALAVGLGELISE
jgi:hypothetical protein